MNIHRHPLKSGALTLAELHAAQCPPCHGRCNQGRRCNADACAPEGGSHADPVPSGTHRQSWLSRVWLRLVRALG